MRGAVVKVAALAVVALGGCSGKSVTVRTTATVTAAPTVSSSETTAPQAAPSGRDGCAKLKSSGALKSAEGFVIVAGVVKPGDVDGTVSILQQVEAQTPLEFQTALANIVGTLQAIDQAVRAQDGRDVDTSAVQPDANLLSGMCRARGFPVPAV